MLIAVGSFSLPAAILFLEVKQMRKITLLMAISLLFTIGAFGQVAPSAPAATPAPTPKPAKFKVGDMAPDFTLTDTKGVKVKLSEFRGKSNVVLAFYVFAFTGG